MGRGLGLSDGTAPLFYLMDKYASPSGHAHRRASTRYLMRFLLFLCLSCLALSAKEPPLPLFSPPPGWKLAKPKNLSSYIRVGFIGDGSTQFHPSINLAVEEVDLSQKEYVKGVKQIHLAAPKTSWTNLGHFSMQAGVGTLTEIANTSPWGEVKMLQAILVKDNTAYILTAAALKKEYPQLQKEILKSLQSLSLCPNLIAAIPDPDAQSRFQQLFASLGQFLADEDVAARQKSQWKELQRTVIEQHSDMGSHWQFLALQEGYAKIYPGQNLL